MRQIKFRGREVDTGHIVYGNYLQSGNGASYIVNALFISKVEPDTVGQLIAVDKNRRDIYEGDLVERIADYDEDFDRAKTFPMAATFDDFSAINNGEIILAEAAL